MKLNFWKYATAAAIILSAMVSCEEPAPVEQTPDPIFPTTVLNETVAAGGSVDITIEPNLAWEVSISGEGSGNMFWLDDDGRKKTKISGKEAGKVTLTVMFSETEEFDINRVCDVTLTMAEESKKIATITRPSIGRTFELYVGVAGESGFTEEFGTEKVSEASLLTFEGLIEYSVPVRVVTNYDWSLALPSWLKASAGADGAEVNQGKTGTTDLYFRAMLNAETENGAEGVVRFIDSVNSDAAFELKLTMPAFLDRIEYSLGTTFTFNTAGHVLSNAGTYLEGVPAIIDLFATEKTAVKVLEWNEEGQYHATEFADWVTVTETPYDDLSALPLARYSVEVAVAENTTSYERFADVFIIPASKADVALADWTDPNTGSLKEEFAAHIIGRISQARVERDYITLSLTDEIYEAALAKYPESQWWASSLGTDNQFELVYSHEYSDAVLVFDRPFASYKVFDYDNNEVEEALLEDFWLTFNGFASNTKGRVTMDPAKFTRTDAEFPESFIVFYDAAGKALAGLSCRYTASGTSVVAEEIYSIASGTGEIFRMDAESDFYARIKDTYSVTEIYQINTNDKHVFVEGQSQYEIWNSFGVDPVTFGELKSPISIEPASPNFDVYTGNGTEKAEALYIFQNVGPDESYVNFAAIYVVYDPDTTIDMPSPFQFVNSSLVGELATLAPYTGDMAATIMGEQYGITAEKIFELKYMDASASSVAAITVPSAPVDNAAWNNYPYSATYWLTCEVSSDYMTVYMSEAGKTDYFLFKDAAGMPTYVLVCTLAQ